MKNHIGAFALLLPLALADVGNAFTTEGRAAPDTTAAKWTRSVSAVRIARGEYQGCPPRVVPELSVPSIPAGAYASLPTNLATVGLYNFAVARSALPEDLADSISDAVFSKHEELARAHPAATTTIPANFVRNSFLPLHARAARWYRAASEVIMGDGCMAPARPWIP